MIEQKDFKRDSKLNLLFLANFALCLLVGIKYLILKEISTATCWISASSLWFINFSWRSLNPFLRITQEELIIFRSALLKPKKIKWETIKEIDEKGAFSFKLILTNGKKIKISWMEFNKDDRKNIIPTIKEILNNKL